jgi:large subunit ribosomal protein L21
MMFAVIRTGGKQARVSPGDSIRIEKLEGAVGDTIELSEVLLVGEDGGPRVGTPLVEGAKVVGTITAQDRADKITVFKMKRRKGYRRKQGHRQSYTELRVDRIEG